MLEIHSLLSVCSGHLYHTYLSIYVITYWFYIFFISWFIINLNYSDCRISRICIYICFVILFTWFIALVYNGVFVVFFLLCICLCWCALAVVTYALHHCTFIISSSLLIITGTYQTVQDKMASFLTDTFIVRSASKKSRGMRWNCLMIPLNLSRKFTSPTPKYQHSLLKMSFCSIWNFLTSFNLMQNEIFYFALA